MAGVDVGSEGGTRRATNSDVNMIPFIDLLMVTVAFLLITAVWVTNSRVSANADVPGQPGCTGDCNDTAPVLHVSVGENDFGLTWRQASTVVSETRVAKTSTDIGGGAGVRYEDLAKAIQREWSQHRSHSDPSDKKFDTAVLHTDDRTSFRELVAVMDAVHSTQREIRGADGRLERTAAFATTFAVK